MSAPDPQPREVPSPGGAQPAGRETLAARLQRNRDLDAHFDPRACAALTASLARAVQALHDAGALHLGLEPASVLLGVDGRASFAAPRASGATSARSPWAARYAAPELLRGERVDARADVFALGALLYELLGHRPPRAQLAERVLERTAAACPLPPLRSTSRVLPRALRHIVAKATAFRASRRYASAAQLADDLDAWLAGRDAQAQAPGLAQRLDDAWLRARRPRS